MTCPQVALCGEALERWGPAGFEHIIRLKTGRTHQAHHSTASPGPALPPVTVAAHSNTEALLPGTKSSMSCSPLC